MVVLVSTSDPGLTIFPTHRIARQFDAVASELQANGSDPRARSSRCPPTGPPPSSTRATESPSPKASRASSTRSSSSARARAGRLHRVREEASAAVDEGAPRRRSCSGRRAIEDVFADARRGEVLPQKTTYFYPEAHSAACSSIPLDRLARGLPRARSTTCGACSPSCRRASSASRSSARARAATTRPRSTPRSSAVVIARLDERLDDFTLVSEEIGEVVMGSGGPRSSSTRSTAR